MNAKLLIELDIEWTIENLTSLTADSGLFKDGDWVESKDQDPNGEVRLIQLADVGDGKFIDKSSRFLTKEKAEELKCTFLKKGDLLIARMPDPLGRACIFPLEADHKYVTVVDVCIVRANKEKVLTKYLMYLLNSPDIRARIDSLKSGSTRKRISRGNLSIVELPIASLEEQKDIVAKIETLFSELDKGIESLKTTRQQLKAYRQAILKHAFEGKLTEQWRQQNPDKLETPEQLLARIQKEREEHYQQQLEEWKQAVKAWEDNDKEGKKPGKPKAPKTTSSSDKHEIQVPDSWVVIELGSLAQESVLGKMLDKQKNRGIERPYLGNINVRWGELDLSDLKSMKIEEFEIERYSLKEGDLVICEGGEPGRCAIWKDKETVFIQKALHRVRFTKSYDPKFAFYYMVYATPLARVVRHFTGTTIKHLTGAGLNKIELPLCSLDEQKEVIKSLEASLSETEAMEKEIDIQIQKSENLRQSILKKAFSGQLAKESHD